MKLYIDNREPKQIIDIVNNLNDARKDKIVIEIKNLELGDYIIYDDISDKNILIIERKSLADLESSIKDGRYTEQSLRLINNEIPNHNIYYLIEGSIINYKKNAFKNTLYSSLISLSYFKGFSIINSLNSIESAEIIYRFVNKLIKENPKVGFYNNELSSNKIEENVVENNYINVIKSCKKSNITKENINIIMLMQIPNVSSQSAAAIMNKYKTIKNLVEELEKDLDCLESIRLEKSNRKIGKNIIENIKNFLLNK